LGSFRPSPMCYLWSRVTRVALLLDASKAWTKQGACDGSMVHVTWARRVWYATWHHLDSSTTSHGLQSSFFSKLHLYFIFVAFSLYLAGHVPMNRATFSSVFYQITARTVFVFDFLWVTQCTKIQSDFCLIYLTSRRKKKESFKNVKYKKNEKSRKLRIIFPFSDTAVSENSLFYCYFVRVCVFLVLVFTWILAWVCTLYCFIIDLLWKSIHYFICYCFAMSTSAIWLSIFVLLILLFSSILVPF